MNRYQYFSSISVAALLLLVSFLLIGCRVSDREQGADPTATDIPLSTDAPLNLLNFYSGRGVHDEFCVFYTLGWSFYQVNIPYAGDYLLTYTTDLGTFHLTLRVHRNSLVTIGLQPNDLLHTLTIHFGTIPEVAVGYAYGTVTAFVAPGCERDGQRLRSYQEHAGLPWCTGADGRAMSVSWAQVFQHDLTQAPLLLVENGEIVVDVCELPEPGSDTSEGGPDSGSGSSSPDPNLDVLDDRPPGSYDLYLRLAAWSPTPYDLAICFQQRTPAVGAPDCRSGTSPVVEDSWSGLGAGSYCVYIDNGVAGPPGAVSSATVRIYTQPQSQQSIQTNIAASEARGVATITLPAGTITLGPCP